MEIALFDVYMSFKPTKSTVNVISIDKNFKMFSTTGKISHFPFEHFDEFC